MTRSITKQTKYFQKPGPRNTQNVLDLVSQRLKDGDIDKVVVASSSGGTGLAMVKELENLSVKVVPVVLNAGSKWAGSDEWKENKKQYEKLRLRYVQGVQALSGVERAVNARWGTVGPAMLISDALRIMGEGFKVAVEIVLMACDAGYVDEGEKVVSVAGTSRGADTALVVKSAYSHEFFNLSVNEILCKPFVDGVKHEAR